jgi:hypothetical protein
VKSGTPDHSSASFAAYLLFELRIEADLPPSRRFAAARKEQHMKIAMALAAALVLASSAGFVLGFPAVVDAAVPAKARNVCLNASNIQRTQAKDDRTLDFYMRDGTVWRNTLRQLCPMLRTSPFSQVLNSGDLVCSNQQFIHVLQTGDMCALGDFVQLSPAQ